MSNQTNGILIQDHPGLITTLVLYIICLLGLGVYGKYRSQEQTLNDHYVASGTLGPFVLSLTLFASIFSAYAITGVPGEAYRDGFSSCRWIPANIFGQFCSLIFAPRLHNLGRIFRWISPTDPVRWRWPQQRGLGHLVSLCMCSSMVIYLIAQFLAMGRTTEGLTDGRVPGIYGALFLGSIMLIYEALGGMRGVAYTDVVQGALMLISLFSLVFAGFYEFGGLPNAIFDIAKFHPEKTQTLDYDGKWSFFCFVFVGAGTPMYGHIVQRIFAAENPRALKISFVLLFIAPFVILLIPNTIGWLQFYKSPEWPGHDKSDQTFSVVLSDLITSSNWFLNVIGALLLSCAIAAMMRYFWPIPPSSHITAQSILVYLVWFSDQFLLIGSKGFSFVLVGLTASLSNLATIDLSNLLVFQQNIQLQLLPAYIAILYTSEIQWQSVLSGLVAGILVLVGVIASGVQTHIFPGFIGLFFNVIILIIVQVVLVYGFRIKQYFHFPQVLKPKTEPALEPWLWIAVLSFYVLATPWYWEPGIQTQPVLGFPLWSFLILSVCVVLALIGIVSVIWLWDETIDEEAEKAFLVQHNEDQPDTYSEDQPDTEQNSCFGYPLGRPNPLPNLSINLQEMADYKNSQGVDLQDDSSGVSPNFTSEDDSL